MTVVTGQYLIDKKEQNKNSDQLKIVIGKRGVAGPKKGQGHRDDQKQSMEQEFDHGCSLHQKRNRLQ